MANKKKATPETDPFVWLSDKLRGTGERESVGSLKKGSVTAQKAPNNAATGGSQGADVRRKSVNVSSAKRHQNKPTTPAKRRRGGF